MKDYIELRSDTTTHPTEEMREAMRSAPVGDDVFGEDPTVNALEALAASKMGKEAALFVPSGTMGNITALLTHCKRGDEVILESECHIYYYEVGGLSALGGMVPRPVRGENGLMEPDDVEASIRNANIHYASPGLICVENTHNRGGGTVYGLERLAEIKAVANRHGLPMHLDGARIFNAAIALGTDVSRIASYFDSVQFCLSKGLSAPVGSVLAGGKDYIARARKYRKMLGGGMRQAGIIAAAGIVALEKMVDRLADDHANARALALGLSRIPGIELDLSTVVTNIVVFDVSRLGIGSEAFAEQLSADGVRMTTRPPHKIRAVTSRMFTAEEIPTVLEKTAKICTKHLG
ncbi:MAG TPA: low-specificity L-threonine aldolase [Bacillota bacterium]|nr:low-specificity L-threonine aldolase [Bacillota bacterium]